MSPTVAGGLRLDLFTRLPVWQPEPRPRIALMYNGIILLALLGMGVAMGVVSWYQRPIVPMRTDPVKLDLGEAQIEQPILGLKSKHYRG